MIRENGKTLDYRFDRSVPDAIMTNFTGESVVVTIYELPKEIPCLLLMCAEPVSLFTELVPSMKHVKIHLETLTEDDDLLSPYGKAKWKRRVRTELDSVFFAGPCTGGSPWNRLNMLRRESTAHLIRMKASLFWRLWEEFVPCLVRIIQLAGMALMELPRGCDYWKDDRLTSVLDGSDHYNHEFDGCMYGLKTKFSDEEESLKKPWRIVSWGVEFQSMRKKCDHSHDHGKCAGRETKATQQYTDRIIRTIVNRINQVVLKKAGHLRIPSPYHVKRIKGCEDWKRYHSMYSEGPRSDIHRRLRHLGAIKRVPAGACVVSGASSTVEAAVIHRSLRLPRLLPPQLLLRVKIAAVVYHTLWLSDHEAMAYNEDRTLDNFPSLLSGVERILRNTRENGTPRLPREKYHHAGINDLFDVARQTHHPGCQQMGQYFSDSSCCSIRCLVYIGA